MFRGSNALAYSGFLDLWPTAMSVLPGSFRAGMGDILLTLVSALGKMGAERQPILGVSERAAKPFRAAF